MLLGDVHTKSRTLQFLGPSQREGWRGTGNWEGTQPGQLTRTGQRDVPYYTVSCSVYKLGGVGQGYWSLLRDWLAISQQVVSNCIVPHLGFFPLVIYYSLPLSLLPVAIVVISIIIIVFNFILFQLLNSSYLRPQVVHFF